MTNQELEQLLLIQTNITTVILAITTFILAGVFMDLIFHLYKKYIKKEKKHEKS